MKQIRFRDSAGYVRVGTFEDGRARAAGRTYDLEEVDVLAPCEPSKIVCVGRNYAKHAEEMGSELPERPMLFLKPPSAVAGHGDIVELPRGKDQVDFEAELAVVIGEQCRNVSAEDAMNVVEGFTCMNDISNRDDQQEEQNWVRGKAFDGSAPLGPAIVPPEEIPSDATVELRRNGATEQSGSRSQLIFPIPKLVEEITRYLTLELGDVIATGTPNGVGPLADGDEIEVKVEGVGTLAHTVRQK